MYRGDGKLKPFSILLGNSPGWIQPGTETGCQEDGMNTRFNK